MMTMSDPPILLVSTPNMESFLNIYVLYCDRFQIKTPVYLWKTPCPTTRPWINTLTRNQDSIPPMHP